MSRHLESIGFKRGVGHPAVIYHSGREIKTLVHGDDFAVTGTTLQLKWLRDKVKNKYDIKMDILGPEKDQEREVKILRGYPVDRAWIGIRGTSTTC